MKALIPQGLIGRPNYFGLLNNSMTLIICESLRQIGVMACVTSAWSSRGQTLNNYRPFVEPMVETTAKNVQQVIKSMLQEGYIDDMTAKWLSLTPNPPRIPVFYTLTKIHKPIPVGRPIISRCDGPTKRISAFVDHLLQPIAQIQP